MGEDPKQEDQAEQLDWPKKYLLQFIVKKTKKTEPTWQDVNELLGAFMKEHCTDPDIREKNFNEALERIKFSRKKIGVMVSFVHPDYPDMMAIGFSLCNFSADDKFDYQLMGIPMVYVEAEGFGKHIAFGRAEEWSGPVSVLRKSYSIPPSIKQQFHDFVLRSQRYYKDKTLPGWVVDFLASY